MFGTSGQLARKTLSGCRVFRKPCHGFSASAETSRCLATWKHRIENSEPDARTVNRVPKRWISSRLSEGLSHHYYASMPLVDMTVGQLLTEAAEKWPNRDCVVSAHQNIRLTYSELLRRVDRLAAGLLKLGLKKGDRIGLWGPNYIEWFIAFMAATRIGLIAVGINPAYQQSEIDYCIEKVAASAIIAPAYFRTQNYVAMSLKAKERCPSLQHIIIDSDDIATGTRRLADVEALANNAEVQAIAALQNDISPYDGCNIQFTSGTTGRPKATLLCHRSFVNNSKQTAQRAGLMDGEHRICLNVPLFHAFGMVMGVFSNLQAGATLVLESPAYNPKATVETILREKCTYAYGTPTMWINLLDARLRLQAPIKTLQGGITGGAPASADLMDRIRSELRFERMQNIYGMTESTAVTFQSLPGEDIDITNNTVGHLSDNTEAMIVDENGSPVPVGTPGELWVRGYSIMNKYWADEENTKKTLTEDGWLKTGDQFILRPDGYGQIVGRLKDVIIRGGENIFPKEIEHFLETHPYVLEACVFGVYDKVYGEEICACIRLSEGTKVDEAELHDFCKGFIAHFKIPRYFQFLENFPRTTSGKIQKFIMREELESRGIVPAKPKK